MFKSPIFAIGGIVLQIMGARQLHASVSTVTNNRGITHATQRDLSKNGRGLSIRYSHKGENLILTACVLSWFGQDVWVIPNRKSLTARIPGWCIFDLPPKKLWAISELIL